MDTSKQDAWIRILDREDLAERLKGWPLDFGFVPAMTRLLLTHERIGPAFGELYAEVMFRKGALTLDERELVATVTAAAQDCFY